jgi:anti-sigma regulatory factor (Ser/Thr protein kinase)
MDIDAVNAAASPTRPACGRVFRGRVPSYSVVRLPVLPQSVAAARKAVLVRATLLGVPQLYEPAALCVSELVTNAVRHARWPDTRVRRRIVLVIARTGPFFAVEVRDPDPVLPVSHALVDWERFDWHAEQDPVAGESGFGLGLVAACVAELGGFFGAVALDGMPGKSVFFALPVAGSVAARVRESAHGVARFLA